MNRGIATALFSIGAAQLAKVPINYMKTGRWDWSNLLQAGGMPSSHSAGVASLTTYTAMKKGVGSIEFALSAIYGMIVMYDAMGIRRHAGEIAVEVNRLDEKVEKLANEHPGFYHQKREHELEERLGHMPVEVFGGSLLGTAIGASSFFLELEGKKSRVMSWLDGWRKRMN